MLNMRDLLVHTAAKLETLHTRIQDAKDHFLEQQRMVSLQRRKCLPAWRWVLLTLHKEFGEQAVCVDRLSS